MIAQINEAIIQGISQFGVLGLMVAWFIFKDTKDRVRQQEREDAREVAWAARETAWAEREEKRDGEISAMREAIHHLIQVTASEVLTRPGVHGRIKRDTEEILEASKAARPRG
jgi:hypothetical protein